MNKKSYEEYCTGCGLCGSVESVSFECDEKGFNIPDLEKTEETFLEAVCPFGGAATRSMNGHIWGAYQEVCFGWALDEEIRRKASSGGVLTALCCFLLKEHLVDGIIQTTCDEAVPYKTKTVISRTPDEVLHCMGSRYSISSPLMNLQEIIVSGETYAFVGKPCDASALRMYMAKNEKIYKAIKYLFSFFCAGVPSTAAQKKLLNELGCSCDNPCVSLRYRGNGWPGDTEAIRRDGTRNCLSYRDSWGEILGRDVRKVCRFCIDGIGELADIACGDAWYLTSDKKPDFTERDGRNIIFIRTKKGEELFKAAKAKSMIHVQDSPECIEELKYMQPYQYERRASMKSMIDGLRICNRDVPKYDKKILKSLQKHMDRKTRIRRCVGIIKRIKQGKI